MTEILDQPNDVKNKKLIMVLLALGWSDERIAAALDCTLKNLRKNFSAELKLRDAGARDQIEAALTLQLWLAVEAGNVVAIREFQRLLADSQYQEDRRSYAGQHGVNTPTGRRELIRNRVGKKELQALDAQTAGEGSEWGDDLKTPMN